ncbi:hypothetical protein V6N13_024993 [Hibiscus sabdariffa]
MKSTNSVAPNRDKTKGLTVEAASLNSHTVRKLKLGIVFTKQMRQSGASEEGTMEARTSNMEHGKARSTVAKLGANVGQEGTSPLLTLTSVEAVEQSRQGQ